MFELVAPTARLYDEWVAAHREWGPGTHEDGFGLTPADDVASEAGFVEWVDRLLARERAGAEGRCCSRWIVDGDRVLGGIALRYGDGVVVSQVGHIGFGVTPSARGRGVASWALGRMLAVAREAGMGPVLLVCAENNLASARTIERNGGVLEAVRDTPLGPARRYRIALAQNGNRPRPD
ncbi:GNAT family N-acetyltransferase [Nocardia takedensis]|uniref:GNAT family N-acetyltransferase n=1 Tax=Nocardia takedensis TaxID=259390 RepID=UPI0002FDD116|nr:GNAT family N-acetyltransferase [Nocardia takedensis]